MTERTLSTIPPIAQSQHASNSPATYQFESAPVAADSGAEEPYTIKCICNYTHADTETICCDKCETWQHFECYYTGDFAAASADDFEHECVDCHPRFIDASRGLERQRLRLEALDRRARAGDDKKTKRPQTKSHKKSKPSEVLTNGHQGHDSHHGTKPSIHEQTKRTKSHHRSQQSTSSQAGVKRSESNHSRHNSHAHPLSPATTPPELPNDFVVHTYSPQFQSLWQNDPGAQDLHANSFASLSVTNTMSSWVHDESTLLQDAGVKSSEGVFTKLKPGFDLSKHHWPKLQTNVKTVNVRGSDVRYRYLTNRETLRTPQQLVGELKGVVGFQKDYFEEDRGAWSKLCHPVPFVFFHPSLPLYIDTRLEGSQCRYVRRSCRPNTFLETYITNGSEYHFCFVNEGELPAGSQITMSWEFKFPKAEERRYMRLLGLSGTEEDDTLDHEMTPFEYDVLSELINNVLSDYGGCACELGHDCAFVRFHRNYQAKLLARSQPKKTKKPRKPKQHVSPASTGHATNSRDTSEGHTEHDADDDIKSTSGSAKPRSRDLTPSVSGKDLVSDRDKRKLADIEKSFEQLDKQPIKKKKRGSDGPPPPAHVASSHLGAQRTKTKGASRATTTEKSHASGRESKHSSRHPSQSPATGISPKTRPSSVSGQGSRQASKTRPVPPRPQYVEVSTQTDPDPEGDWYRSEPQPKKKFVPLSRRLIQNHRRRQEILEAAQAALLEQQTEAANRMQGLSTRHPLPSAPAMSESSVVVNVANGTVSPVSTQKTNGESAPGSPDVVMTDTSPASMPPPPHWPGVLNPISANTGTQSTQQNSPPELKIQLPSQSQISPGAMASPSPVSGVHGHLSPAVSVAQSPLGTNYPVVFSPSVQASVGQGQLAPVKKKLSLKEYNSKKKAASATPSTKTESAPPVLKTSSSLSEVANVTPVAESVSPQLSDSKPVQDTIMADAPPLVTATVEGGQSGPADSL